MLRIDSHTHAFSEKIAAKVVSELVNYYGIPTDRGACLPDLLHAANQANLDGIFLLVAATKASQVRPANDWILAHRKLSPAEMAARFGLPRAPWIEWFGSYHPDDRDWEGEIDRLRAAGVRGIKLHPEFQRFDLLDKRLGSFFEKVQDNFAVLTHVGDPRVSENNFSTPTKIARIISNFPRLRLVAAHFGGLCFWRQVVDELAGKDVYLDTSSAISYMPRDLLSTILRKHDRRRVLFGSDYPLGDPVAEMRVVEALDELDDRDKAHILGENARDLWER